MTSPPMQSSVVVQMLTSVFLGSTRHSRLFGRMMAAYLRENADKVFTSLCTVSRRKFIRISCERLARGACHWPLVAKIAASMFQRKISMCNNFSTFSFGDASDPNPVFIRLHRLSQSSTSTSFDGTSLWEHEPGARPKPRPARQHCAVSSPSPTPRPRTASPPGGLASITPPPGTRAADAAVTPTDEDQLPHGTCSGSDPGPFKFIKDPHEVFKDCDSDTESEYESASEEEHTTYQRHARPPTARSHVAAPTPRSSSTEGSPQVQRRCTVQSAAASASLPPSSQLCMAPAAATLNPPGGLLASAAPERGAPTPADLSALSTHAAVPGLPSASSTAGPCVNLPASQLLPPRVISCRNELQFSLQAQGHGASLSDSTSSRPRPGPSPSRATSTATPLKVTSAAALQESAAPRSRLRPT